MKLNLKISLLLLVLGGAVLISYVLRLDALVLFLLPHSVDRPSDVAGFQLSGYRVSIDAKPLPGLTDASGLTYHAPTNTLFAVLNQEPLIIQLSLSGDILRKIRVDGAADMEDITHVRDQIFVLVDESKNRMFMVDLSQADSRGGLAAVRKISLGFDKNVNRNFEGVSWDAVNGRLLVAKEKEPKRLLEIRGFADIDSCNSIEIRDIGESYPRLVALRDLAAVSFHEPSSHLLVLSEESKLILEFDGKGRHVSSLLMWRGFHGIQHTVPQPEGLAVGPDDTLYVISEPNLFYVFKPSNPTDKNRLETQPAF